MLQSTSTIETRDSWVVASVALFVMMMAFGAAWIIAVALKDIAGELGGTRSIPALASSLAWLGQGTGGILMGRLADRFGTRWTVLFGALMIGVGLSISTLGTPWALWIGHGLFMGLIGLGGINAPMYIYVSRWFDRRRGSALALISSGSYLAGAIWPPVFERAIAGFGWRSTMLCYAVAEIVVIVPLALIYFRHPPELFLPAPASGDGRETRLFGLPRNLVFVMMCGAGVLCCIPMAMPQGHLVAFCTDLGISRTIGALMLSVLLGTAFLSRQIWGVISDRIGGLATVLIASAWQAASIAGFLFTQNETGLFTVAAAFGLGFSGIIPAYVLAVRELFPASEASWRIPTLLLFSGGFGMAAGGWLAGLLYDHFGTYAPAFAFGVGTNLLNLVLIGTLVARQRWRAGYA
jgi:MFS family permease